MFLGFSFLACAVFNQSNAVSGDDTIAIVQVAKKDLAQRLGISERSIELVGGVEAVTWPDSSLGCPKPDKMYAQMLTPGCKFKLQGSGKIYDYHAGQEVVKMCKS